MGYLWYFLGAPPPPLGRADLARFVRLTYVDKSAGHQIGLASRLAHYVSCLADGTPPIRDLPWSSAD